MPRRCSVSGCKSNYDSQEERYSTFALPKDEDLRKKWLLKIPTDFTGVKNPYICERHFAAEDIIRVDKVIILFFLRF